MTLTSRLLIACAAIAGVFGLAACSGVSAPHASAERGQSLASAQREIAAMPGVTSAHLDVVLQQSGLAAHHQVDADVVITSGAVITDQNALVEQIARIAWSANEVVPDQGVYLNLVTNP